MYVSANGIKVEKEVPILLTIADGKTYPLLSDLLSLGEAI